MTTSLVRKQVLPTRSSRASSFEQNHHHQNLYGYNDDDDDDDEEQEHFSMNKSNEPSQRGTQTLDTSTLPSDDDEETTINDRNQWAHDSTVKKLMQQITDLESENQCLSEVNNQVLATTHTKLVLTPDMKSNVNVLIASYVFPNWKFLTDVTFDEVPDILQMCYDKVLPRQTEIVCRSYQYSMITTIKWALLEQRAYVKRKVLSKLECTLCYVCKLMFHTIFCSHHSGNAAKGFFKAHPVTGSFICKEDLFKLWVGFFLKHQTYSRNVGKFVFVLVFQ